MLFLSFFSGPYNGYRAQHSPRVPLVVVGILKSSRDSLLILRDFICQLVFCAESQSDWCTSVKTVFGIGMDSQSRLLTNFSMVLSLISFGDFLWRCLVCFELECRCPYFKMISL